MFALTSASECRCQSSSEEKRLGHPSDLSSIQHRRGMWAEAALHSQARETGRGRFLCQVEDEEVKSGSGWVWDSMEEMTELTPEACRILFSASMSNAQPKTGKGVITVTCFWLTYRLTDLERRTALHQTQRSI